MIRYTIDANIRSYIRSNTENFIKKKVPVFTSRSVCRDTRDRKALPGRDIYYAKYYGNGGRGEMASREKNEIGVREKMKKGKEKRRKITLKRGKRP